MKKKLIIILIAILILTIIACFIGILINKHREKAETTNLTEEELAYKEYEDTIMEKLQEMSELERIQVYYGEFLNFIEIGEYERAYDNLNEDFKNTYFNDLEIFRTYMDNNYPRYSTVEYEKFDRYGDIFVLKVKISSTTDDTFEPFEQNVVVHEFGAHNYKISFEVKETGDESKSQDNDSDS